MQEAKKLNLVGRTGFTEPIIVSGKCLGIKLISAYDFMFCTKLLEKSLQTLKSEGFDESFCLPICECACITAMCLYNLKGERIFKDGIQALKGLTPQELKLIYEEYVKLNEKATRLDKKTHGILESVRKYISKKQDSITTTGVDFLKNM